MNLDVLTSIFTPENLLMMNLGVAVGILIGAMPGLSVTFGITVVLTFTYGMESLPGMFLLLGVYCGGIYGGSITAILINTPGTSNAAATVFDGYPLARSGRAGDALRTALLASTIGGLFSAFALMFLAPQIAKVVLLVASPEYFSLCVFGLLAAVSTARKNRVKGIISALVGLMISTVGMDTVYGTQRLMFGNMKLIGGISTTTVMLGTYALCQVLIMARDVYGNRGNRKTEILKLEKPTVGFKDIFKYWKTLLRSSVLGTIIGAVPGTGGATAAMLCYNEARRGSKNPDEFGTGCLEGIIAPECGNNAVTGATMIPMLTLGIPGDSVMAILLGALTMKGITPGAQLFQSGSVWVYAIMGGLFLINVFLLVQGLFFSRAFSNVSRVPMAIMVPCIVVICSMGAYAINNTTFQVSVLIVFGIVGFLMKRFNFPIPPLTIGLVLGNLFETNLRRSLLLSDGNPMIFITRPVSCAILILSLLFMFLPDIKAFMDKRKAAKGEAV